MDRNGRVSHKAPEGGFVFRELRKDTGLVAFAKLTRFALLVIKGKTRNVFLCGIFYGEKLNKILTT